MNRLGMAVIAAAVSLLTSGCGENTQVTVYEQGKYQGKADTRPWSSAGFHNDQAAWDKAIRARTSAQDEYARIGR
jgi:hypothetical protein